MGMVVRRRMVRGGLGRFLCLARLLGTIRRLRRRGSLVRLFRFRLSRRWVGRRRVVGKGALRGGRSLVLGAQRWRPFVGVVSRGCRSSFEFEFDWVSLDCWPSGGRVHEGSIRIVSGFGRAHQVTRRGYQLFASWAWSMLMGVMCRAIEKSSETAEMRL